MSKVDSIKRMVDKLLAPFFIVFGLNIPVFAQERGLDNYTAEFLTVASGVPYENVDGLAQDDKGFVWISTFGGGLARYDGDSFLTFTTKSVPALKSNLVTETCTDNFGRLWITSVSGIDVLDMKTLTLFDAGDKVYSTCDGQFCNDIIADAHGCIWYNVQNEIYRVSFDSKGGISDVDSLRCSDTDYSLRLNFKDVEGDGSVWTSLDGYIYKIRYVDGKGLTKVKLYPNAIYLGQHNKVSDFLRIDNSVWIGSSDGLYILDLVSGTAKRYAHSLADPASISHNQVTGLALSSDGEVVVGTLNGVNIYNPVNDGFVSYNSEMDKYGAFMLSDNQVRSLETVGDQIWAGTELGGITILKHKRLPVTNVTHRENDMNSLPPSPISAIFHDSKGRLWLGSVEHGLLLETSNYQFKCFTINNSGLYHNSVNAIAEDPVRGTIWVGTMGGKLNMINENNPGSILSVPGSGSEVAERIDNVNNLVYDSLNDCMWICSRSGLFWYDLKTSTFGKFGESLNLCYGACIDSRNRLWVGHQYGLVSIDLRTQKATDYPDLGFCFSITEDEYGNLWIGTFDDGLLKTTLSSPGEFKHYHIAEGLSDDRIRGVLAEGDYLWITTENGLTRINIITDKVESFSTSDGLASNNFYDHAISKDSNGVIYLGHKSGFSILWSNYVLPKTGNASRVIFTMGLTDKENVNLVYENTLRVKESQRYVAFEFADLSFEDSEGIVYSTRIYPMDKDWRVLYGDSKVVRYAGLPGGKYKLQVRATDLSGNVLSEDERDLVVKPRFYKTWWFILLFLIFVADTIYSYIVYRTRNLRRMRTKLQREVERQTKQLSEQKQELEDRAAALSEQNKILLKQNEELASRRMQIQSETVSSTTPKDSKFVDNLMNKIQGLYKDPDLDINSLSSAMGMSRSVLNGKIQDSFGQSIGQFIRNYRLNVAKEIISNGNVSNMNVSEIAYEVGFNDPKYFTRCFSKEFGMAPSVMMGGAPEPVEEIDDSTEKEEG